MGDAQGASGTLNVNTGEFKVTGSDFTGTTLIVGNRGAGVININNGADVNVPGFNSRVSLGRYATGSGSVRINGAGSTWNSKNELWVGEKGNGSIVVENGGSMITSSPAGFSNVIGTFNGSNGAVTVTGPGSSWNYSNTLNVGNSGDGSLTVTNGGQVTNYTGAPTSIGGGTGASGSAAVSGVGSLFHTSGTLYVGSTGTGSLAITGGGVASSGRGRVGGLNTGSGSVLVSGAGSTWNITNQLHLGFKESGFTNAPGTLTINPGAKVNVGQDIDLDSNGVIKLQGGALKAATIGHNGLQFPGQFQWTSGELSVGLFRKSLTNQGGVLAPGQGGAGRTTVDGNYTQQAGGAMKIDLGGTIAETQHDFVYLEGLANLGGQLQLALINSFVPSFQQTFTIMDTVGGMIGSFANVANGQRLPTMDGFGSFLVNYGAASSFGADKIVLSGFEPNASSDFDGDGDVDSGDLNAWTNKYGDTPTTRELADGKDQGGSFLDWQRNFKPAPTPAVGGSAAAVPEPSTMVLAAFGLAASLWCNARRSK